VNELLSKYPQEVQRILARYPAERKRSAVMPLLFLAQAEKNYITPQAIAEIGEIVEVSATEVASVAGFYTLFHEEPGGRYRIQVCTDLACVRRGAERFLQELKAYLGIEVGQTTADGMFSLEEVKCLAACHRAPMFQLQGDGQITYHEDQTLETVRALVEELRARAGKEA